MTPKESAIEARRFGSTDLRVSEFGLGCARIGGIFKRDPAEFTDLLAAAYDFGISVFDTSNIYSQGESETLIGRVFRGRRDQVVIASKAGFVLPSRRQFVAGLKPIVRPILQRLRISRQHLPSAVRGTLSQDFSPASLRKALEGSLRRLATDRLDLLQLHAPPLEVVERGEWIDALDAFKREGKIRYYGVSCENLDASLAALRHPGVSSIQVPVNILERRELPAIAAAHDRGVAVIARECLANGMLVKPLQSAAEARQFCDTDEEAAEKFAMLERYREVAARRRCTTAQLALGWVTEQPGVAVSLIGVSRLEQLQQLAKGGFAARDLPPLP